MKKQKTKKEIIELCKRNGKKIKFINHYAQKINKKPYFVQTYRTIFDVFGEKGEIIYLMEEYLSNGYCRAFVV